MGFSTFFSEQARRPKGLFGRMIMSIVFDRGNALLNGFVGELISVQPDDRIIEIGFGTGKLIKKMAQHIDKGVIVGVDLSSTMVSIAKKRNKKSIAKGKVKIFEGNFDEMPYEKEIFSKACSVNTLYFWPKPEHTARKIAKILQHGGKLILAFEDIKQLEQKKLDKNVFHFYHKSEVQKLLIDAGFSSGVCVKSRERGKSVFNCVVAKK